MLREETDPIIGYREYYMDNYSHHLINLSVFGRSSYCILADQASEPVVLVNWDIRDIKNTEQQS